MNRHLTLGVIVCLTAFSLLAPAVGAETRPPLRRFLYVTVPDGAGGSKGHQGVLVFDIDNGHTFVRKIHMRSVRSTRGVCASAVTDRLYISHSNGIVLCMDLKTDKELWEKPYVKMGGGCDRIVMTPDGKKVYIPSGYWSKDEHMKVVDGITGELRKKIIVSPKGGCHDALCSVAQFRPSTTDHFAPGEHTRGFRSNAQAPRNETVRDHFAFAGKPRVCSPGAKWCVRETGHLLAFKSASRWVVLPGRVFRSITFLP